MHQARELLRGSADVIMADGVASTYAKSVDRCICVLKSGKRREPIALAISCCPLRMFAALELVAEFCGCDNLKGSCTERKKPVRVFVTEVVSTMIP